MADYEPAPRGMLTQREWRASQIIRITAIATLTVLAIVGMLQFLVQIRTILLWVLIGVILAIALQPAVGWLVRHRWNRVLASLLVSFGTVAVLVGIVIAVAYPVVFQADDFIRALPRILDNLFGTGGQLNFLETRFHVVERVASVTPEQVTKVILGNQDTIVTAVTKAASLIAATITILTIMVMMLIEGPRAWQSILDAMIDEERTWAGRIGDNFLRATGGYVRGNLAISVVAGIASYIVLKILGDPLRRDAGRPRRRARRDPPGRGDHRRGDRLHRRLRRWAGWWTASCWSCTSSSTSSSRTTCCRTWCTARRWRSAP